MRVLDIGFYDGKDSNYYLKLGLKVIAFEANPLLYEAGRKQFASAIGSGQLQLHNMGIGMESGQKVDFYLHTEYDEWSTFLRKAAINWGPGKSKVIQVPCITPREMFERFGCPYYLKSDIEGADIVVADELQRLSTKPDLVSFEASNIKLLKALVLAGYQSFKLVDQARVPLQKVKDAESSKVFDFSGGTGPFGDDAEGEWVSFENLSYLYHRFVHDPFSPSTPEGHWFDIHASLLPSPLGEYQQRNYLKEIIDNIYNGHCGMKRSQHTPICPAINSDLSDEVQRLQYQLGEIHSSLAWKLIVLYRQLSAPLRSRLNRSKPYD